MPPWCSLLPLPSCPPPSLDSPPPPQVAPLQHLMYSAYSYKALKRDCPHCTEEISLISTRCK